MEQSPPEGFKHTFVAKLLYVIGGVVSAILLLFLLFDRILIPLYTSDKNCYRALVEERVGLVFIIITFVLFWTRWKYFAFGFFLIALSYTFLTFCLGSIVF